MGIWSAVFTDNHRLQTRTNTRFRPAARHRLNGEKRGLGRGIHRKTPASAATGTQQCHPNPRQHWRLRQIKKKPAQGWLLRIGGPPGSRTRHQRIMLTSYGFRHPFRVCGLDCLLSLRPARTVSTRSLLRELRSGLPRRQGGRGFPEFEQFYLEAESTCFRATRFCTIRTLTGLRTAQT